MPTDPLDGAAPGRVELELQVLRADGWRPLLPAAAGRRFTVGWREPVLKAVLHAADGRPPACHLRLEGVDRDWVDVGMQGWRIYTRLRRGRHLLQLRDIPFTRRGACRDRTWLLELRRPPWRRWWAWLAYLVLALGAGWGGRRVAMAARPDWRQQVAELGHELRTPLSGMLGTLELWAPSVRDRRQQRHLQTMRQCGVLLTRLIDDCLHGLNLPVAEIPRELTPFAPVSLCRRVVDLMRPLAARKRLRLHFAPVGDLPTLLQGDASRIEQLLFNLLGNAIKYTARGQVTLATRWRDGAWWLWVQDTGPGIPAARRRRAFRRFVRLSASNDSDEGGLGLGLAVSRRWVRRMGGQISVHGLDAAAVPPWPAGDEAAPTGTVVRVRLPLRRPG